MTGSLDTSWEGTARAGGFFLPDNGTEPMGRGGTFVAKADSPLAMYYNVAGIARQTGLRLTVDANIIFQDIAFTRAGVYPGDPNAMETDGTPATPWAGKKYPTVHDQAGAFLLPALGMTWQIPWVRHLAIGFGVYGPPSVGKHQYGDQESVTVTDGKGNKVETIKYTSKLPDGSIAPTPSRYDLTTTNLLIVLPTFGAAWGPVKWLEIGGAFQLVYGNFDLMNANMTNLGRSSCIGGPDYPGCDSYGNLKTSGVAYNGLVSLMLHPASWIDIGAQYQPYVQLHTTGTLKAYVPPKLPNPQDPFPVSFDTALPHKLSIGARAVSRYADGTERADLELDAIYERWQDVQTDHIHAENVPPPLGFLNGGTLDANIAHYYQDTYGIRVGGAYNHRLNNTMRLTGRAGFYFDSAASNYANTHLDFNSAAKYAFTLGGGFKVQGFTINLAYAYVFTPDRNVMNGDLTPVSSINGTNYMNEPASTYIYNNGRYQYSTHIVSVGLTFNFSEFNRKTLFAN